MNYAALKTEVETDPAALGFAPLVAAENWQGCAALLNAPKAGFKLPIGVQPSYRVVGAVKRSEWDALTAADKNYLTFLIQAGDVDLSASEIRTALGAIFPAGSVSRANLLALVDRSGSRAEELFGAGTIIGYEDVIRAIRGGI